MKKYVIKYCQTAYFEIKRISSFRRFLIEDAAETLVTSYIFSRLDYCNCLQMDTSNYAIQPLQQIRNVAAKESPLGTPLPPLNTSPKKHPKKNLHWLPIWERITYKIACMYFSAMKGSGPAYLSELLHVYTPSRTLRSSSDNCMLNIQQYKRNWDSWLSHFLLLWTQHLEFIPTGP